MEGRDEKGRFAKGNKHGHRFSNGDATECQQKSLIARKENQKVADVVRRVLSERGSKADKTKMDDFVEKVVYSVFKSNDISLDDLLKLQKILGEDIFRIESNGLNFSIDEKGMQAANELKGK